MGTAEFWNTRDNFMVEFQIDGDWRLSQTQIYAGEEPPEPKKNKDKPDVGKFPCRREFAEHRQGALVNCSLKDELDHRWGGDQTRHVAIHADLVKLDGEGNIIATNDLWVF
ncbi:MAG: hypothetical protein PVF77_07610, partial [Anaerolineae bacterium]